MSGDQGDRTVAEAPIAAPRQRPYHPRPTVRGEANPNARLSDLMVTQIFTLAWRGNVGQAAIARFYGVHRDTVRKIKTGEIWSHLGLKLPADQELAP